MGREDDQAASQGPWPLAIPRPRSVPAPALVGLAASLLAGNAFMVFRAFREPERWLRPARWLAGETGGLVNLTLSANLLNVAVFVVGVLVVAFRQAPRMLGLDPRRLPAGLAGSLAVFAAVTTAQVAFELARGRFPAWDAAWFGGSWRVSLGHWFGQLLGNAPFEEVVYRGFFLPQAYLLAGRRLASRPVARLAVALVLSQGIFAVIHVPVNAAHEVPQAFLLEQFALGLALAGVYLASGNLFLAIGLHTLINEPPPPFASPISGGLTAGLFTLALIPILSSQRRSRPRAVAAGPDLVPPGRRPDSEA